MKKIFLLLIVAVACYAMADDVTLHKPLQLGPKNRNQIVMQGFEVSDTMSLDGLVIFTHLEYDSNARYRLHMNTAGTVVVDTSNAVYNCTDVFTCIDTDAVIATQSFANSNYWNINGNAGTNPATNFIGTTDKKHVIFKQDNKFSGILDGDKTMFGVESGELSAGSSNSVFGSVSFLHSTTGSRNTAIGQSSLIYNNGDNNTAIGFSSQAYDTLTCNASMLGYNAVAGYNSTAIGSLSYAPDSNTIVLGDTATLAGVGIGTSYPNAKLHVVGSIKIVDSTQGAGKVLTSDANGLASWQPTSFTASDSATIYALTPANGTTYFCSDCSGDGVTGRIVSYFGSLWRRLKFD